MPPPRLARQATSRRTACRRRLRSIRARTGDVRIRAFGAKWSFSLTAALQRPRRVLAATRTTPDASSAPWVKSPALARVAAMSIAPCAAAIAGSFDGPCWNRTNNLGLKRGSYPGLSPMSSGLRGALKFAHVPSDLGSSGHISGHEKQSRVGPLPRRGTAGGYGATCSDEPHTA